MPFTDFGRKLSHCGVLGVKGASSKSKEKQYSADIIIYGGTSAAIIAAVEAVHSGKSVLVISPDTHLGGLSSGGLGLPIQGINL